MKCNGCGGKLPLAAVYAYGEVRIEDVQRPTAVRAKHRRTLCPRCHVVMNDILLRSDLSDHWDDYDWEGMDAMYEENYE